MGEKYYNLCIRNIIYVYFYLILFDGLFRKWIFPSQSAFIMIIKQFIGILIFFLGLKYFIRSTLWEKSFFVIGIILFLTSLVLGHGNIYVAFWGCIPYWFGLSVSYIIACNLNKKDFFYIGKIVIYTTLINSLLIILQFYLPPSHILNFTGGEVQEHIAEISVSELAGGFRPPGIFMHNSQSAVFSLFSISYIMYFLFLKKDIIDRKLLFLILVLELISVVCSTSRTNVFYHISFILYFFFIFRNRFLNRQFFQKLIVLIPIIFILINTPIGHKAINNIGNRFDNASHSQYKGETTFIGTIYDIYNRTINYNIEAIISPKTLDGKDVPVGGYGQGISTQVGGRLLNIKKNAGFALAEWDGLRIMCESGLLFGWIVLFIRLGYVFRFIPVLRKKIKNPIAVTLYPIFFILFYLTTTWGNAFFANFAFFIAGLFLACIKKTFNFN